MSLQQIQKEKIIAIFYTVSSVILSFLSLYILFSTYLFIQDQKQQILAINQLATETQQQTLQFNTEIRDARQKASSYIPSNFESFYDLNTSTGDLTRMFDTLEQNYQASGQNFLIRSISYGQLEQLPEQRTSAIRASLSLTTTADNLLSFLRDIEKTGLSSDRAFYFLDPVSLNFNNVSNLDNLNELSIDLQLRVILKQS